MMRKMVIELLFLSILAVTVAGCDSKVTPYSTETDINTENSERAVILGQTTESATVHGLLGVGDSDTEFVNSTEYELQTKINDSFNSYYHLENGEAVADIGTSNDSEELKDTEIQKGTKKIDETVDATEISSDNSVSTEEKKDVINFVDSKYGESGNNGSTGNTDGTVTEENRVTITTTQATVNSVNKFIPLTNDSQNEIRYQFEENDNLIFDSGIINPGETVNWNAYDSLTTGEHELSVRFEQISNGVVVIDYKSVANIRIDK